MTPSGAGLTLLAFALADAPLPAYLQDPRTNPTYPPSAFLCGIGRSDKSADQAEAAAKAEVSSEIKASLQSLAQDFAQEVRHNGQTDSAAMVSHHITLRSSFSRAELIQLVPGTTVRHEGIFYALACLSRAQAGDALAATYEAAMASCRQAIATALASEANPVVFAQAFTRALGGASAIGTTGTELTAVDPSRAGAVRGDLERLGQLAAARERVLSGHTFTVSVQGLPAATARIYAGDVAEALRQLGLRGGVGSGGVDRIEVQVQETCEGRLGICCRWQASARITVGGAPGQEVELQPREASGCDRADQSIAREKLLRAVRPSDVAFRLLAPLSALLPIAEIGL